MSPITVLVVDDHDLLREGVSACLAAFDDIDVVAEAPNGETAIATVAEAGPDVVVMDLVMPGIGGVETIRRPREAHPTLGTVALSSFSEGDRVRSALDAGANGYLMKSVDADSLAWAVRSAAAGQSSFSPEVMKVLVEPSEPTDLSSLTAREVEIAELMANGLTNSDIADDLHLSVFTVKNHVSSILMKLHVRTRTEAASVILTARSK